MRAISRRIKGTDRSSQLRPSRLAFLGIGSTCDDVIKTLPRTLSLSLSRCNRHRLVSRFLSASPSPFFLSTFVRWTLYIEYFSTILFRWQRIDQAETVKTRSENNVTTTTTTTTIYSKRRGGKKGRGKRKNRVDERSEETRTSIPKICMCSRGRTSEHVQWRETRRTRA